MNNSIIKYADEQQQAVYVGDMFIPRGHRFWAEYGVDTAEENGEIFPHDYVEDEQLAMNTQCQMESELKWVDIQLKYHATNDKKRATIPLNTLYEYAIACRDHVQLIDNKLTIFGEKPTRPQK